MSESDNSTDLKPLERGVSVIRDKLATLPDTPGVYRMLNSAGDVLYVGKAKSLKKRVVAYTRVLALPIRLQRMVAATTDMTFVTTTTESEALLMESDLIKKLKPRYNILLRDDKSFPYICITGDHEWPRIVKHRGAQKKAGDYFGPFASAGAVNRTLTTLQKAFLLRSCSDSVFANRTRPCLLHQIKRCAAPCVGKISHGQYMRLIEQARAFLSGESHDIQKRLATKMEAASAALDFEEAAIYRDRIRALTQVQSRQDTHIKGVKDADIVALAHKDGRNCIQVFFYRAGQNCGNRAYFPQAAGDDAPEQVMDAFLGQFYARQMPPKDILLSTDIPDAVLLAEALSQKSGYRVHVHVPKMGERKQFVELVAKNAADALARKTAERASWQKNLHDLAELLGLNNNLQRVEIYDNSHIRGTRAVGAMVVCGPEGFTKNAYRTFNMKNPETTPGDDYAMMREVFKRRFARAQKDDADKSGGTWPDLVILDGGKGQLSSVMAVLDDMNVADVPVIAVSKGPDRHAGEELIHQPDKPVIKLPKNHVVQFFIQRLRDEAHRFAIGTHRNKRRREVTKSPLDGIEGIGPKRKKALLYHFGSAKAVAQAKLSDLQATDGISRNMAQKIFDYFHSESGAGG